MVLGNLRTAIVMLALFTLITGMIYPALVTVIAGAVFPDAAGGSLMRKRGTIAGSSLIGQPFSSPKYFWGRLSATAPVGYNAAASSGSNFGPLNPALLLAAEERAASLRVADLSNTSPIPVDLLTASASGLDPHISAAAALYQVSRVARERNLPADTVRSLVARCTEGRDLGFLGEPAVNVLELNLALDDLSGAGGIR